MNEVVNDLIKKPKKGQLESDLLTESAIYFLSDGNKTGITHNPGSMPSATLICKLTEEDIHFIRSYDQQFDLSR